MRVIAGSARHLPLKSVPGTGTRPTTDRIKETLFNILNPDIPGCRFLDLFAGSGGIGIEALSRGASYAVFIEKNAGACRCIKENLEFTRLADRSRLIRSDAVSAIRQMTDEKSFDIIFMDPPYGQKLEQLSALALLDTNLVSEDTVIIFEADIKEDLSWISGAGFEILRTKTYKTNMHVFLRVSRREEVT